MNVIFNKEDKLLKIELQEEIDHHTTEMIRRRADYEIQRNLPDEVLLDFSKVSFMDSAGIGMIIGRYKLVQTLGGKLSLTNLNVNVERILKFSGILNVIPIYKEEKGTIKNEGCI